MHTKTNTRDSCAEWIFLFHRDATDVPCRDATDIPCRDATDMPRRDATDTPVDVGKKV